MCLAWNIFLQLLFSTCFSQSKIKPKIIGNLYKIVYIKWHAINDTLSLKGSFYIFNTFFFQIKQKFY